jgi:hypothetical protein
MLEITNAYKIFYMKVGGNKWVDKIKTYLLTNRTQ